MCRFGAATGGNPPRVTPPDASPDRLREALRGLGHDDFRPGQREALQGVLDGRDVMAILPTGAGKSLVFQLAARLLDAPVLVISPLVALMRDQEQAARDLGSAVGVVDSTRSARDVRRTLRTLGEGRLEMLMVTPERLGDTGFTRLLRGAPPALVVVDEAHCVSSWGHDFRPAYLGIADAVEAMGRPPVLALTATAPDPVREDITALLRLRCPLLVTRGLDRPNLYLEVVRAEDERAADRALERVLAGTGEDVPPELDGAMGGKGIVYVTTTRMAGAVAQRLRRAGVAADHYHGRRAAADRRRVQDGFADGSIRVVVATNAFGLGIDDPDVRFVVHRDPPGSIEAWWQEAGRAGRDGRPARCVLIHRPAGLSAAAALTRTARVSADLLRATADALRDGDGSVAAVARATGVGRGRAARAVGLLEEAGVVRRRGRRLTVVPGADPADAPLRLDEARALHERTRAEMLRRLAETDGCRRAVLLPYLGDRRERPPCGMCDRDRAGCAPAEAPAADLGGLAVPGTRVVHDAFGAGVVQGLADEALTVLFDAAGYRTLDPALVAEQELLRPAPDGAPAA